MDTVSGQLVKALLSEQVKSVFCVPGESFLGITNAIQDHPEISLILCRQEGSAGFMAIADGQIRGRAGVCMVSRGPGVSNAMIALHSAYQDAMPLVVLIGQVESKEMGRMALQEQNYASLLADVTKAVFELRHPAHAAELVARAFSIAESGTPGVVALVMPEDILGMPAVARLSGPSRRAACGPRSEDVDALAEMLERAERPVVWVGGALVGQQAREDLHRLAEAWTLPVCPTNRRPHLFDSAHPCYGGYIGIRTPTPLLDELKRTDLLVALGERLTDAVSQSYSFPAAPHPQVPLVHVWPDPAEVGRVWHPTLGLACDPHSLILELLRRTPDDRARRRRWDWVRNLHETQQGLSTPVWDETDDGVNLASVVCAISKHLEPDAAITTDAGNFSTFVHRYIGFRSRQIFLSSVVGAMGSGVPMAVAAALENPQRQVVGFAGDGGMLMTGNELATARLYGVSPVLIVCDNQSYSTIAMHQSGRYPGRPFQSSTRIFSPDFAAWARAFGARGLTLEREGDVASVIADAFSDRAQPVVVHVRASYRQTTAWRRMPEPS